MSVLGAAEPPMGMQRIDEMSHCGSFSRMAWIATHTVGTAPTSVTRSLWTISMMSRGWGLGPPKICVEPFITPAKGTHQALAWNGSTQIFGGPNPQPRDIIEIVHNERVTL